MGTRQRRFFRSGLLAGLVALAAASLAWACTPTADIEITPDRVAAGGGAIDVQGRNFLDGATVQVRWNAADGPLLATATARGTEGARFSVPVTVPKVPEDTYTVLALAQDKNGEAIAVRESLVVGQPGRAPAAAPEGREPAARSVSGGETGGSTRATTSGGDETPARASAPSPAPAVTAAPATTADAGPAADTPAAAAKPDQSREPAAARPSERSATSDLWSGFRGGKAPAAAPAVPEPVAVAGEDSPQMAIGAALLALGLVGLVGAFGVAELRRRRAPATRP